MFSVSCSCPCCAKPKGVGAHRKSRHGSRMASCLSSLSLLQYMSWHLRMSMLSASTLHHQLLVWMPACRVASWEWVSVELAAPSVVQRLQWPCCTPTPRYTGAQLKCLFLRNMSNFKSWDLCLHELRTPAWKMCSTTSTAVTAACQWDRVQQSVFVSPHFSPHNNMGAQLHTAPSAGTCQLLVSLHTMHLVRTVQGHAKQGSGVPACVRTGTYLSAVPLAP